MDTNLIIFSVFVCVCCWQGISADYCTGPLTSAQRSAACFCDPIGDPPQLYANQPLINIKCELGSTLQDVIDAVDAMAAAKKIVRKVQLKGITNLPNGLFKKLQSTSPIHIEISDCGGRLTVASGAFDGLQITLQDLKLRCELATVPPLSDMRRLRHLRLQIGISRLTKAHLQGLSQVRHLDLSGNGITSIEPGAFDPVPNLTHLLLGDNLLPADFENSPSLPKTLVELHYGFSGSMNIGSRAFALLRKLETLHLSVQGPSTKKCSFVSTAFNSSRSIKHLKIDGCDLSAANSGGEPSNALPRALLKPLTSLQTLELTNCQLGGIELGQLRFLTTLRELSLRHNKLFEIPSKVGGELSTLDNLEVIDLSGNPWDCGQQFKLTVIERLQELANIAAANGRTFRLRNANETLCATPKVTILSMYNVEHLSNGTLTAKETKAVKQNGGGQMIANAFPILIALFSIALI